MKTVPAGRLASAGSTRSQGSGDPAVKPGAGRPRSRGAELSPADHAEQWRRELLASGGHRTVVNLNASAWMALQELAPRRERGPLIERLILAEARRRRAEARRRTAHGA